MSEAVVPFIFKHDQEQTPIRALVIDSKPWFVGADCCVALGLNVTGKPFDKLKPAEKGTYPIRTPGGLQQMVIINREGFTRLVMRSDKPQAEDFQDWIIEEVLPALFDTGRYEIAAISNRSVDGPDLLVALNTGIASIKADIAELKEIVEDDPRAGFSADSERYACEGVAKYENCECIFCRDKIVVTKFGKRIPGACHLHHGDFNARNFNADNCVVPCIDCHKQLTHPNRADAIPHWKAISIATAFHEKLRQKARQIKPPTMKTSGWDFRFATQPMLESWPQARKKLTP